MKRTLYKPVKTIYPVGEKSKPKRTKTKIKDLKTKEEVPVSSDELLVEQELRNIYYSPTLGYQSAERLYQSAQDLGLDVSRKVVKDWLKTQDTYTIFKPVVKKLRKYQRTFVTDLGVQIQMDLVDMKKYSRENKGYYWILTAVEILSRYAFTIPVYRKDTKNMSTAVRELLDDFKDRFGKYPKVAQFDEGLEFYNVGVKQVLNNRDVEYFSSKSTKKAAVVERFNRTLKTAMWKYFYKNNTKDWLGVLDKLTYNYNNVKHSTIKMKPVDVNESNKDQVFVTLYGYGIEDLPVPKFKVGDRVRITKYKHIFKKGYEANFTNEIFKISRVFTGDPNMYEIVDNKGEEIIGKFYEQEMSLVL